MASSVLHQYETTGKERRTNENLRTHAVTSSYMSLGIEAGVAGTATAYSSSPHVLHSRDNGLPAVDPDQYIHVEPQLEFETWQRRGWPMGNETSK